MTVYLQLLLHIIHLVTVLPSYSRLDMPTNYRSILGILPEHYPKELFIKTHPTWLLLPHAYPVDFLPYFIRLWVCLKHPYQCSFLPKLLMVASS